YGFYRLYRPCIDSASFNNVTRELVIKGSNLQAQRTDIGIPTASSSAANIVGTILTSQITSLTPTEIHATLNSTPTLERLQVVIDGQVWSDPVATNLISQPAPVIGDMVDINGDIPAGHTPAAPNKLMSLLGAFACAKAQAQSLPYPASLGNCT